MTSQLHTIDGHHRLPEATGALRVLCLRSKLTGTLLTGYPVGIDAVLVSDKGQVTVIDLVQGPNPSNYRERQDQAFVAVDRLLRMNPRFTTGRTLRITVQTVTMATGILQPRLDDQEHPLANTATIVRALQDFQNTLTPKGDGMDHDSVLNQIMQMPFGE